MEVSQLHATAVLSPEKESLVPIGQEAGWTADPFWKLWGRETSLGPAGDRVPVRSPDRSPSLYRLSYPGYTKRSTTCAHLFLGNRSVHKTAAMRRHGRLEDERKEEICCVLS
jgi:hypothetical protein